jgi:hypothetical protein
LATPHQLQHQQCFLVLTDHTSLVVAVVVILIHHQVELAAAQEE